MVNFLNETQQLEQQVVARLRDLPVDHDGTTLPELIPQEFIAVMAAEMLGIAGRFVGNLDQAGKRADAQKEECNACLHEARRILEEARELLSPMILAGG